ncbi:MAG: HIT domain-containing protein [Candidatus Heimdallarchaeota archaeon]|nr:HIT domain-containing protein [Candidatus Heimdallarchaeota archaeon]MDH5646105.1 HIT domain-containing protein [Candidatus Heimdallarchaeota archaeon]
MQDCLFCKIVNKEIPSEKIYETEHIYAFMDINPLADGHCLFIPKKHAKTLHDTPDTALADILIAIKKVVQVLDIKDYNILQNNGIIAHQAVFHAHWHLIPKPNKNEGLSILWNPRSSDRQEEIASIIREKLSPTK